MSLTQTPSSRFLEVIKIGFIVIVELLNHPHYFEVSGFDEHNRPVLVQYEGEKPHSHLRVPGFLYYDGEPAVIENPPAGFEKETLAHFTGMYRKPPTGVSQVPHPLTKVHI